MSSILLVWIVINVSFVPMAFLWRNWIPPRRRFLLAQAGVFAIVWGVTFLLFGNRYGPLETGLRSLLIPVIQQAAAFLYWRFGRGAPRDRGG